MTDLPVCRWRGEELSPGRHACSSRRLVVSPRGVSAGTCAGCFCRDHEPPARDPERERRCVEAVQAVIGEVEAGRVPAGARLIPSGPGTELMKLLRDLGINPPKGCECKRRAAEMDAWGVEGCRQRRAEIVGWMREAWGQAGWGELLLAAARAAAGGLALRLDPFDVAGSLIDEANRRAVRA